MAAFRGETDWDAVERHGWWMEMVRTQFAGPTPANWESSLAGMPWGMRAYATYKGAALFEPDHDMSRYDLAERLRHLPETLPILVVSSDHDANYVAPARIHAAPLPSAHAETEFVRFDSAGHFIFAEEPEAFAASVLDFMARRVRS